MNKVGGKNDGDVTARQQLLAQMNEQLKKADVSAAQKSTLRQSMNASKTLSNDDIRTFLNDAIDKGGAEKSNAADNLRKKLLSRDGGDGLTTVAEESGQVKEDVAAKAAISSLVSSGGLSSLFAGLKGLAADADKLSDAARQTLADPNAVIAPLKVDGKETSWVSSAGNFSLFPNGKPTSSDVQQHGIGDCYFDSAIAALASANPDLITNAIHQDATNPNVYTVDMYSPSGAKIAIAVNDDVLSNNQGVSGGNGHGNWATIMEKAFAKYNDVFKLAAGTKQGGETGINGIVGGSPNMAMDALSGSPSAIAFTSPPDSTSMAKFLQDNLDKGGAMVAVTLKESTVDGDDIVSSHAFSVENVYQDAAGQYRVQVRNPWGVSDSTGQEAMGKSDDGLTDMSIDEFNSSMDGVIAVGAKGQPAEVQNINTRLNAYSAAEVAQHKAPDANAVGLAGQTLFVAGPDSGGTPQMQVFEADSANQGESNFLGGTTLQPNTSYEVNGTWINVDAAGKPQAAREPSQAARFTWDGAQHTFAQQPAV